MIICLTCVLIADKSACEWEGCGVPWLCRVRSSRRAEAGQVLGGSFSQSVGGTERLESEFLRGKTGTLGGEKGVQPARLSPLLCASGIGQAVEKRAERTAWCVLKPLFPGSSVSTRRMQQRRSLSGFYT